jgi:anti-sigma factor RsiW
MRCEEIREILEERGAEALGAVRTHLESCAGCAAYARDWETVRQGFELVRAETAAEPSLGFAARLMRRLDESQPFLTQEFFEAVGRRFVPATFALALLALLALALPSSGPLRGPATSDLLVAQSEVEVATADPMIYGFESGYAAYLPETGENGPE